MNLQEIKSLIHHATKNDVLLGVIPSMVNASIRYLEDMRSWSGMADTITINVVGGATSASLPAGFKEPQGGYNPILVSSDEDAEATPWMLISKQEMGRLQRIGTATGERKAYIDFEIGASPELVFPSPVQTDSTITFDAYFYLPDLVSSSDHNWFTDRVPMLVVWKAIALLCSLELDQASQAMVGAYDAKFDKEFLRVAGTDSIQQRRGRSFRMGGV